MEFGSLQELKEFLENSDREERWKEEGLKKVEKLFNTNLYEVVSKLQSHRKDIVLMADFYPDYNMFNDYGKVKAYYIDSFGAKCSYLMNEDKRVEELVIVYSIMGEEGKKVPIAFVCSTRDGYIYDKTMCLRPDYLKEVELNLLYAERYPLLARKSEINDAVLFSREKLFSSHPETERIKGDRNIFSVYVARGGDAHSAVINYPKLNTVMWEIVGENVEKLQEEKARLVIAEIKNRKRIMSGFSEEIKTLQEDIAYETALIATKPKDKASRGRIKGFLEENLAEKEEFKEQEKALVSQLHGEVKTLKTQDAKKDLKMIL